VRNCSDPSIARNSPRLERSSVKIAGARELTEDVVKEWFFYFFQCTECRRCSLFLPYGIDTAEITIIGRELLNLLGLNIDWVVALRQTVS
jgi:Fe-S oxidoreductase